MNIRNALIATLVSLATISHAESPLPNSHAKVAETYDLGLEPDGTLSLPGDLWIRLDHELDLNFSSATVAADTIQCDLKARDGVNQEDLVEALSHAAGRAEGWSIRKQGTSNKGDYFMFLHSQEWVANFGISTGNEGPLKMKCILMKRDDN